MIRRYVVPALLLTFLILLAVPALAQGQSNNKWGSYYDTFSEKWLDRAKWDVFPQYYEYTLDFAREIQNGKLRLAIQNFGNANSNSGMQQTDNDVAFVDPNAIQSITADVTLHSFSGIGCAENPGVTFTTAKIGGNFFNMGSGDPADDVNIVVYLWVDTSDPETMRVGTWGSLGWTGPNLGTDIGSYRTGTSLTVTLTWDKTHKQFVTTVKAAGNAGPGTKVVVDPYDVSDSTPPAFPWKAMYSSVFTANCTTAQTFAQSEAFYDNVMINAAPTQ